MKNYNYTISINGKDYDLKDFDSSIILPEIINSIKINFEKEANSSINTIALMIVLQVLIEKVKNKSEYTLLLENFVNSMLLIKKLEIDAGLGADTY